MSTRDPMFWIMVIIAASFVIIAIAMVAMAVEIFAQPKTVDAADAVVLRIAEPRP